MTTLTGRTFAGRPDRLTWQTVTALGAGALALGAGGMAMRAEGAGSLPASILVYAMLAAWMLARIRALHPFDRFGPANAVTLARAVVVSLIAGTLIGPPLSAAAMEIVAAVALAALVLDGFDGWLARRTRLASPFGARFDMETDALFALVLAALVFNQGKVGAWVLALGVMRYAFVAAGRVFPALAGELFPSLRRKAVCVFQIAALCLLILPAVQAPLSTAIALAAVLALCWSFAVDILFLMRRHRATADEPA